MSADRQQDRLEAAFLTSAPSLKQCPRDDIPEIAFAGRSNAGKSSVLNTITGNKKLAKVSKTPGRTQLLNLFSLASGGRLVDLPGYGYAKAGKQAQEKWQSAVNQYLSHRDNLRALVIVMDIRHPNQPLDQELIEWAEASELPTLVLLNKADKLSFSRQKQALSKFLNAYPNSRYLDALAFSALKGTGRKELIDRLMYLFDRG